MKLRHRNQNVRIGFIRRGNVDKFWNIYWRQVSRSNNFGSKNIIPLFYWLAQLFFMLLLVNRKKLVFVTALFVTPLFQPVFLLFLGFKQNGFRNSKLYLYGHCNFQIPGCNANQKIIGPSNKLAAAYFTNESSWIYNLFFQCIFLTKLIRKCTKSLLI